MKGSKGNDVIIISKKRKNVMEKINQKCDGKELEKVSSNPLSVK